MDNFAEKENVVGADSCSCVGHLHSRRGKLFAFFPKANAGISAYFPSAKLDPELAHFSLSAQFSNKRKLLRRCNSGTDIHPVNGFDGGSPVGRQRLR